MRALLIDTDPGCDDALAIAFALRSRLGMIAGIAASAGNAVLDTTRGLTAKTLDYFSAEDIPLASGSHERDDFIRKIGETTALERVADALAWPRSPRRARFTYAQLVTSALRQHGDDLVLVALAPLTNVARFLTSHPDEFGSIKHVVVLAGAFTTSEWTRPERPGAELNVYMDHVAAQRFFAAGHPNVTLMSLDTANEIGMDAEMARTLGSAATPGARLAVECYTRWCEAQATTSMPLWDPVCIAAALDPSLIRTEPRPIAVLADGTTRFDNAGPTVKYVTWIDSARFLRSFMALMT